MTLEDRLTDALAQRANTVTGTRIASDGVVAAGRSAHRRRQTVAITTVTASVVALVVAIVAITATGRPESARPPGNEPTASPSAGVTPTTYGLSVLSRNIIIMPDGGRVSLPFADGVVDVAMAKNGWVVTVSSQDGFSLWFVPEFGQPRRIGTLGGNYKVSADGTVLVATGIDGPSNVDAYRLPSLERIKHTTFDSAMGPMVAGIAGDRVLLNGSQGSPGASTAAVWNLGTGSLRTTPVDVWILGVARDGRVLRRIDWLVPGGKERVNACIDVVMMTDTLPTGETGYCDKETLDIGRGSLSPNGDWAVVANFSEFPRGVPPFLIRTAELREGRLSAEPMNLPGRNVPEFWDSNDSFIGSPSGYDNGLYRCTTSGKCTPITLWPDVPAQRLIPPMV